MLGFKRVFSIRRLAHLVAGTALCLFLFLFQGTFTSIKNAMFQWNGAFIYDQLHANIDKMLHFGVDPWRLVAPMITNETLRTITEFNYNVVYFTICFSTLYFVATSPRADKLRTHYIACFLLTWIVIGNVMAGLFLSAGPVFYRNVTGDTARFAELVTYLAQSDGPNAAAHYQAYLWSLHQSGISGFGSGISAFPSIHVGMAALNMFFAYDVSRRAGFVMTIYAVFILLSSVALGWHYAIDGYVSIIVVGCLYYGLKWPLRSSTFTTNQPEYIANPVASGIKV